MTLTTNALIERAPALTGGAVDALAHDFRLRACCPIDEGDGPAFWNDALVSPLRTAMPGLEDRCDIAMSGHFEGGHWLARSGHLAGLFAEPLFGIPASRRVAFLRYGRFDRFEGARVVETLLLLDLPALMIEAGVWPLGAPLGPPRMAPGPATRDGVAPASLPDRDGAQSVGLVEAMIAGLGKFDGGSLRKMGMTDFWTDDFWWYGPAPIGNFRGHADYERGHQAPFLAAFPDRKGGHHRARFGERHYACSTGWPSIYATHKGGDWLGLAATSKPVTMRVMDFWRRDAASDLLIENWVMIDIADFCRQLGCDVFARMAALTPDQRS